MEQGFVRDVTLVLPDRVCRGGLRWQDGIARLLDGTMAGSAYPLRQGLKLLVKELQYPLPDAVRYVTSNPAQLLGIDDRVGSLSINKEATFVRLSPDFEVKAVWFKGQLVFQERGVEKAV